MMRAVLETLFPCALLAKKSNQTEIPETGKNTTTAVKNPKGELNKPCLDFSKNNILSGQNAKGKTKAKKNVKGRPRH